MKLIDRHILRELTGPFLFGVAAFTTIFFAGNYLLKLTSDVLKGMSVLTAVELVILYLPGVVVLTLPMSMLLAVLLGFSRLSSDSEIAALYSSGVSLRRIAVPVLLIGLAVSGASFLISEVVVPGASVLSQEIRARALREPVKPKEAFTYVETHQGVTTQILVRGGIDVRNRTMKRVSVVQLRNDKPFVFFEAEKAVWEGGDKWTLHNGYLKTLARDETHEESFGELRTQVIRIDQDPKGMALHQRKPEDMSLRQLLSLIRTLKPVGGETRELEIHLYNKISLPLASLVFAAVGLPLGIRPHRSGSSYGMGLSVIIILAYWLVWHTLTALAMQGNAPPALAAFAADIAGMAAAAVLLARTPN